MKKTSELLFLGSLGGSLYYGIEVLYRGFSHWSMFLLGGICMIFIEKQGEWSDWNDAFWRQVLRCVTFVACGEFITGILVNKWMKWNVWDYSDQRFQLFGQICLRFTLFFAILCMIAIKFCEIVSKYLYPK